VAAITMTGVGLRKDAQHICQVRALDEPAVEHLLSQIIEFVGKDSS